MSYCDAALLPFHGPYHNTEYGFPIRDDSVLFERLMLEINQAGLSWLTILKKREGFTKAYHGFDIDRVARYGERDRARLLGDAGIIRNRLKINAAIQNAQAFLRIQHEFGSFDTYMWQFVGGIPIIHAWTTGHEIPTETEVSRQMSKDLLQRGFHFVGPTICYAHMQAVGMVNDHTTDCFRYQEILNLYG